MPSFHFFACTAHACCMQEELIQFTLEDVEIVIGHSARVHDSGVTKACPQYIDEGLVQQVILICERIQNGSLALKALSILSRTISRLPVPPNVQRRTTDTGVRLPTPQTYLAAIHACCCAFLPQFRPEMGHRMPLHLSLSSTLLNSADFHDGCKACMLASCV